jgi:hypothetical protein
MEDIKDLLTCKLCNKILSGTPIVLSCCDATICGFHLDDQLNQNTQNQWQKKIF